MQPGLMCCGTLYKWSCMHVQTFWCRSLMNSYSTVGQVFCLLDNSILSACAVLVPAYAAYLTVFWWCITMTWATLHTLRKMLGSPVCVFKVNTPLCSLSAGLVDCAIDVHTSHSFFFLQRYTAWSWKSSSLKTETLCWSNNLIHLEGNLNPEYQ